MPCRFQISRQPAPFFHPSREEAGTNVVSKDEARHVLYYRRMPNGEDGGGFVHALLRLIETADQENTTKLRRVYPGYVVAMKDWFISDLQDRLSEED